MGREDRREDEEDGWEGNEGMVRGLDHGWE